ncbi:cdcd91d7-e9df-4e70-816d-dba369bf7a9d [Thermothielavioides terrestris]|uniref:Cdcd91d7-e9df-4e70-816d-dba369bf7a9d n=2 Tax=Thermothielavioides terrestris TaxID=2587410 RepID=A0A446BXC0_9PEZI|nr:cdcd91d7-e9df-4e70-816d-dba369bf7a9d [Thermothielavioides terrestris]
MLPTLVRRLAQAAKPQLNEAAVNYKYKLKKVWPPDMGTMSPQQQLRFEKKYKRRLKLASARPRWDKFVRLAQLFTVTFAVSYMVLFMDWKDVPTPFDSVRERFWGFFGVFTEESRKLKDKPQSGRQ